MKRLVAVAISAAVAVGVMSLGASTPASAGKPHVTFSLSFGPNWGPGPFWPGPYPVPGPGWWGPGPGWGPAPIYVQPYPVKCKIVYEYQQVWYWDHWAWVQVPVKKCAPPIW